MEINATLVVQLAVFLTLMLWLSRVLFAPLMKLFDERELRIQGAKNEAKQIEAQGLEKIALVEEKMKTAQRESRELLTKLKADGAAYHRGLVDEAKAKARDKLLQARDRISTELEGARSSMKPFIEENASLLANKFSSQDVLNSKNTGTSKMEFRGA